MTRTAYRVPIDTSFRSAASRKARARRYVCRYLDRGALAAGGRVLLPHHVRAYLDTHTLRVHAPEPT